MIERRGGLRLLRRTGAARSGSAAKLAGQHLDRDFAPERRVARAIHLAHAARAERREYLAVRSRLPAVRRASLLASILTTNHLTICRGSGGLRPSLKFGIAAFPRDSRHCARRPRWSAVCDGCAGHDQTTALVAVEPGNPPAFTKRNHAFQSTGDSCCRGGPHYLSSPRLCRPTDGGPSFIRCMGTCRYSARTSRFPACRSGWRPRYHPFGEDVRQLRRRCAGGRSRGTGAAVG